MHDPIPAREIADLRQTLLRLKCEVAWLRFMASFRSFAVAAVKAGFNPGQLRIPAGQPGGGKWTDGGGSGLTLVNARGRTSVTVRVGNGVMEATPAQAMRLANADAWARNTRTRVEEIDPKWRPEPSLTGSVEGEIAARESEARQAEARLRDLEGGRSSDNSPTPSQCIASYRSITGMSETGGSPATSRNDGTVAYAEINGRAVFGVNSSAPSYTATDQAAAEAMRSRLIENYPEVMATDNVGRRPNDALFHAEANTLLRAEAAGQNLSGRTIEMQVDRLLCPSCDRVLPLVGLHVGNPTVRITDGTGALWIMRDGTWARRGRP